MISTLFLFDISSVLIKNTLVVGILGKNLSHDSAICRECDKEFLFDLNFSALIRISDSLKETFFPIFKNIKTERALPQFRTD